MAILNGAVRRLAAATSAAAVLSAAVAPGASAQAPPQFNESQVKAAFLYKFVSFVEWPTLRQAGDFVIGIVGDDPFGSTLDQIVRDKTLRGRRFVVRRLRAGDDLWEAHILFVGASEERRISEILQTVEGQGVLTVGETMNFVRDGGVIRFYIDGSRIRFEINAQAAEQARLKISAQLLSLGR